MKRFNPFIAMITDLRSRIESFCFHRREELVLDLLWSEYSKKHVSLTRHERVERLTDLLWKVADKTPNP